MIFDLEQMDMMGSPRKEEAWLNDILGRTDTVFLILALYCIYC